jgi:CO/xanthine dehydrogenase FAD-binding subunit
MVEFETGRTRPDRVIDIHRVPELRGIEERSDGLWIGALSTCSDLIASDLVRRRAAILVAAADEVGAEQIKNRATIAGNLGTASPAADLVPVLFALDARVRLASRRGRREMTVSDFLCGYRENRRHTDELIEAVILPPEVVGERHAFRKVGTRRAQSIAKVVVALSLRLVEGRIHDLRAAAGSVAPTTVFLSTLARELEGVRPKPATLEAAARLAVRTDVAPIDDVRSSAAYRCEVLYRVCRSMLVELVTDAV